MIKAILNAMRGNNEGLQKGGFFSVLKRAIKAKKSPQQTTQDTKDSTIASAKGYEATGRNTTLLS